jgi:hypothetical protein
MKKRQPNSSYRKLAEHNWNLPYNIASLARPMNMGTLKNLNTSHQAKLVNYILEAIEKNLLTLRSAAKELGARIDVLNKEG